MPQSLSRILIHLVFSTRGRARVIAPDVQAELHPYLAGVLDAIRCNSIRVGGVEDHVHLFFALARDKSIAQVVEHAKTSSSKWIKTKGPLLRNFHWQNGYAAFSVSSSMSDKVVRYVASQAEHHRRTSFEAEYRKLLQMHGVPFDEEYVWD